MDVLLLTGNISKQLCISFFFASVNLSLTLLFNVKLKFQDGRRLLPVKEHIAWQILNCLKVPRSIKK